MKKSLILVLCGLLLGAAAAWAAMHWLAQRWHRSAVDNTFWPVVSRLDQGGEALAYFHAEEIVKAARELLSGLARNVAALPEERRAAALQGLDMLDMLLGEYGLAELSGVGFSSFAVQPGLHRVRAVLHHRPGRSQGLLWNVVGSQPRPLDELKLLPADTALAVFSDYDIFKLLEWTSRMAPKMAAQGGAGAPRPTPEQAMAMIKAGMQGAGVDYDRLRKSYGGRLGLLLALDAEKRVLLPGKAGPVSLPEPEFALLVRVRDAYLFETLKAKLPPRAQARTSEAGGLKKIAFPRLPTPLPLEPVVVQKGEWLIAASRPGLADRILDVRAARLGDGDAFRRISRRAPRRGNGFGYADPQLARLLAQVLRENGAGLQPRPALEKIASLLEQGQGMYWVLENSDQGLLYTIHHGLAISSLPGLIEAFVQIAAEQGKKKAAAAGAGAPADPAPGNPPGAL